MNQQYDDPVFFEKYSEMPRSRGGLEAAGEWHVLRGMLPELSGKRVLDLGCGYGWHCRYAAEQGAESVLGIDCSGRMLARAREMTRDPRITYRQAGMEELELPEGACDVVLSSLAIHYLEDFPELCGRVYRWLSPGGWFVFSVEHPIFTAQGPQDWCYDAQGNILHWPVDRYSDEGLRHAVFLGEPVEKYHRTVETYLMSLLRCGFALTGFAEPKPPAEMMDQPGTREELRRPMMMLVSARKNG